MDVVGASSLFAMYYLGRLYISHKIHSQFTDSSCSWILVSCLRFGRNLRLGGKANCMPPVTRIEVPSRGVDGDSVILQMR